jgi:alpha-glucosidase
MKKLTILFSLITLATAAQNWHKTASFYQIYPQTFLDGGGGSRKGFGTFKGIESKLDYIKNLGIDCIWLTPVFRSSYNAFGYDITDYMQLDDRYGSDEDFKNLVDKIHEKDMKVIVDFVPNHCGQDHAFFQFSKGSNTSNFIDWFVWAEGKNSDAIDPPNNWQRIGGGPGSGWEYVPLRGKFYYSQFHPNMPDFNLRNEDVKNYFKDFLNHWMDIGLDGFRVDAISHGIEFVFPNGTYPDEPIANPTLNETDFGYLNHIYTQDQPELFDLIYDWRDILDNRTGDER